MSEIDQELTKMLCLAKGGLSCDDLSPPRTPDYGVDDVPGTSSDDFHTKILIAGESLDTDDTTKIPAIGENLDMGDSTEIPVVGPSPNLDDSTKMFADGESLSMTDATKTPLLNQGCGKVDTTKEDELEIPSFSS